MEVGAPPNKPAARVWRNWVLAAAVVTLLFVAILLPQSLPHRHSPRLACLANLKSIQGAKEAWMREHGKTTNDTPRDADLYGRDLYLVAPPLCPAGGNYALGKAGEKPRCSIPGHVFE